MFKQTNRMLIKSHHNNFKKYILINMLVGGVALGALPVYATDIISEFFDKKEGAIWEESAALTPSSWDEASRTAFGTIEVEDNGTLRYFSYSYTTPYTISQERLVNGTDGKDLTDVFFYHQHSANQQESAVLNKGSGKNTGNIKADFISNYADNSFVSVGAAIGAFWGGSVKDIDGVFINNSVKARYAYGGAMRLNDDVAYQRNTNITGVFIGNTATDSRGLSSGATGGALSVGNVVSISADFIGNHVDVFQGNGAGVRVHGGAIESLTYIGKIDESGNFSGGIINSNFIGNYAQGVAGDVKGGAIYAAGNLNIMADNGSSIFKGNYVKVGDGPKDFQAVWMGNENAVLTLEQKNNGAIYMYDNINGVEKTLSQTNEDGTTTTTQKRYDVKITGDGTGVMYLYNDIKNADVSVDKTTVSLVNNETYNYEFTTLASDTSANWQIDIDAAANLADTINVALLSNGTLKLDKINVFNGNVADIEGKVVQVLKTSEGGMELDLSDKLKNTGCLSSSTTGKEKVSFDTVLAKSSWDTQYKKYISYEQNNIYGKYELATSVTHNDSLKAVIDSVVTEFGTPIETGLMGDTLRLVNQLDEQTKSFDASTENDLYTAREDIGTTKGKLSIDGKNGILDLAGHTGFDIPDSAVVSLKNVKLVGKESEYLADITGGTLTISNTELSGVIINNGTLEVNADVVLGKVLGKGTTDINADTRLVQTIEGNTVNVKNAILKGTDKLGADVKLIAQGAKIDLETHKVNLKKASFNQDSTLMLKINSLNEYGSLTAETINIEEGAKLKATLAKGLVTAEKTETLQLLSAQNIDFNNFADSFDNNMYHFEKKDKNGAYEVSLLKTSEDVIKETGARIWVGKAAKAWIDGTSFVKGSFASAIADKLADLAQNNAKGLIEAIKSLAPAEVSIAQENGVAQNSRLFNNVATHLGNPEDIKGYASGDEQNGVIMWADTYINEAKIDEHKNISGLSSDSRGIIAGIEKKLSCKKKIGLGVQYDDTDVNAQNHDMAISSLNGFIYGEYKSNDWFVNGIATYGRSDYKEKKNVAGIGVKADYDAETFGFQVLTGYEMHIKGFNMTPETGLRYVYIRQNGYKDSADQSVSGNNSDILTSVIGVNVSKNFELDDGITITPKVRAAISYDLFNDNVNSVVTLSNGSAYSVKGEALNRFGVELSAGLTAEVTEKVELSFDYEGRFRQNYRDHTGTINLKYKF